jgi:hypothetical protein
LGKILKKGPVAMCPTLLFHSVYSVKGEPWLKLRRLYMPIKIMYISKIGEKSNRLILVGPDPSWTEPDPNSNPEAGIEVAPDR